MANEHVNRSSTSLIFWESFFNFGGSSITKNRFSIISSDVTPQHISGQTTIQKDICMPMFIVALFTSAKAWKQPMCPLTEEWIKKMWYIYIYQNITKP